MRAVGSAMDTSAAEPLTAGEMPEVSPVSAPCVLGPVPAFSGLPFTFCPIKQLSSVTSATLSCVCGSVAVDVVTEL